MPKTKTAKAGKRTTGTNGHAAARLEVIYRPLADLKAWPRNPRTHDVEAIAGSEREFGFRDPIAINETTREIEEGHGRVEALTAMRAKGESPPAFVHVRADGEWLVPTLAFQDTRVVQERYALAHNRAQERGETEDGALARILRDLQVAGQLAGTGYSPDEVTRLLGRVTAEADARTTLYDQAIQIRPQQEYVVVLCETAEEWDRLKVALSLKTVRRGGYRYGSPFDDVGTERVVKAAAVLVRLEESGA